MGHGTRQAGHNYRTSLPYRERERAEGSDADGWGISRALRVERSEKQKWGLYSQLVRGSKCWQHSGFWPREWASYVINLHGIHSVFAVKMQDYYNKHLLSTLFICSAGNKDFLVIYASLVTRIEGSLHRNLQSDMQLENVQICLDKCQQEGKYIHYYHIMFTKCPGRCIAIWLHNICFTLRKTSSLCLFPLAPRIPTLKSPLPFWAAGVRT